MKPGSLLKALFSFVLCVLLTSTASATRYSLTLDAQGSGTVTADNTNSPYPAGATITLTATPGSGWYLDHWSGNASGNGNPLQVTMNSDLVITGNFLAYPTYSVTLVTNGQGTIALNPSATSYVSNTLVTATATPAAGWVFVGWSGVLATTNNPVSLTVDTNVSLTATFAEPPAFDLQPVSVTNLAGGTVVFSAQAVGTAPLGYHWFFSGGALTNATGNTLALANVSATQAGNYWVVATNPYGSATSSVATLTLTNAVGPTNVVNSLDEASLRAAIAVGGWVGLRFNGTVMLTSPITISNNVFLDGTGVSALISGGNAVRLFYVAPGATFGATNLTLEDGLTSVAGSLNLTNGTAPETNADAGAIFNDGGTVSLVACTVANNSAEAKSVGGAARGGAIFNNGGAVTLAECILTNNSAIAGGSNGASSLTANNAGLGGAIFNTNGTVVLVGCNLISNLCEGLNTIAIVTNTVFFPLQTYAVGNALAMGGAVFQASGSLAVTNCTFDSNQVLGGNGSELASLDSVNPPKNGGAAYGGAVAVIGGSSPVDNSEFIANAATGGTAGYHAAAGPAYGGAVYSTSAVTVSDSLFLGNQVFAGNATEAPSGGSMGVSGFGGGLYNAGLAVLNRCAVCSNSVAGGSAVSYPGTVANGGNGWGAGIFNASQLATTNSTIALNSAAGGSSEQDVFWGIIPYGGEALGGGIFNNAGATFIAMNLTIASNSCSSPAGYEFTNGFAAGDEIANTNGTLSLHNSILAYGTNGNAYGPITDAGYNLCSDDSASLASGSSFNNTDPLLGPLGNYGGPTPCLALLANSPAIDSADPNDFPSLDQRGYLRPTGAGPDIGAYEYGSAAPVTVPYLSVSASGSNITLSFAAVPSKLYRLQWSTNLTTWTDLSTNGPATSATTFNQTVSKLAFSQCYFRLLVQ